jgi:putative peptidoglycan lipid II flippase
MTGTTERGERPSSEERASVSAPPASPAATEPATPEPAASELESAGTVARNSAMMAVGSIISRVTGLLRTTMVGAAIGAAAVSDNYNLANTLPNMAYELLLGGVLASVIVPLLVRARTNDTDQGEAYTQRLLTLATVFLAGATLLAVAAAPLLTRIVAPGDTPAADRHLITILGYLLLPEIFFYGLAALIAAVLNTRGHFAAPMWTPILNNLVVIATAVTFMLLPSVKPLSAGTVSVTQILVLGVGTTLGIVIQAAGLWPALRRVGFKWKWRWDVRKLHLRELARISSWMLGYVVVSQIGVVAVLNIAKRAGNADGPGPAIFLNASLIFLMAHGIVAVSIMTALMPRMSAAAAQQRYDDLADQLSMGTRLSAVILVPATAAYLVLGRPLAVTLFQFGNYHHPEAVATGWVIAVSAFGLVPFAISQLQIFAFYAMPDTRTPALVNIPVVALRIAADVVFLLVLPAVWVAAGLTGGNTISFVFSVLLGYWLLRRRIGRLGLARVLGTLVRLGVAALLASVPAALAVLASYAWLGDGKLANLVALVAGGVILVGAYVPATLVLQVQEVRELSTMVRSRVGR